MHFKAYKYKNYVNSCKCMDNKWCFNNKNGFTVIKVVQVSGGSGQKISRLSV